MLQLHRLTYWTRHSTVPREDIDTSSILEGEGVIKDDEVKVKENDQQSVQIVGSDGSAVEHNVEEDSEGENHQSGLILTCYHVK